MLFDEPLDEAIRVLDDVTTALNDLDPNGDVTAEAGVALLPDEASHPVGALDRADRRILPGDYAGREEWLGDAARPARGAPARAGRGGSGAAGAGKQLHLSG